MKKKELIEELISMGGCDAEEEWEKGYDSGINNAITLCNQLDEPELPVIPQFVADFIKETQRNKRNLRDAFHEIVTRGLDNENAEEWIEDSPDAFARAWLYGYTIEKEPQWVVKDDTGYLSYLQFSMSNIYERETSLDKNDAYKFNSKSKADLVADLVGGEVEEVIND